MTSKRPNSWRRGHAAARPTTDANPSDLPSKSVDLLTTSEVGELLRRTPRTIRNWVKAGRLRPLDVPGPLLFRRQDLELLFGSDELS